MVLKVFLMLSKPDTIAYNWRDYLKLKFEIF